LDRAQAVRRRQVVAQTLDRELHGECQVIFVESVCNDTSVLERNLLQKISMSPDYCAMECEAALADLRTRIAQYESQYETLTTHERLSFIKLFDLSSELHLNLIYGSVARLVPYMMGIHIGRRPIWLVRAAHCEDAGDGGTPNSSGEPSESAFPSRRQGSQTVIVPRAAALSEEGLLFAQRLGAFVRARCVEHHVASDATLTQQREAPPATAGAGTADSMRPESTVSSVDAMSESGCVIYTSTLPRAIQTASFVPRLTRPHATSTLNPLDRGVAYGLTEEAFATGMAEDYARWRADLRHTRFPGGESYSDLIARLEPTLIELEQQTSPVLVVSHVSTLQVLSAYFTANRLEEALATSIPHHTVIEFKPSATTMMWERELIHLDDAVPPKSPATPAGGCHARHGPDAAAVIYPATVAMRQAQPEELR